MQMIELKLNMINQKSRHLINALDRSINHLSNRDYSKIPLNIQ